MITSTVVDGKYRIERILGRGGMGAVYLATHLGTDRSVALKVIASRYAADPVHVERFRREARAAGRIRHPNVVDVTDFGIAELDGKTVAYLVMEYLDGCSLAEIQLEDPKLPLQWTVDVVDQLCLAITGLHGKGIVHRDLKPSNIWLEPNLRGGVTVKVLDFGLARLDEQASAAEPSADSPRSDPDGDSDGTDGDDGSDDDTFVDTGKTPLTRAGSIFGTPGYMSPEQCAGLQAGPSSDIYSLGVIVYQMLSGAPPFVARGRHLVELHRSGRPKPLHDRAPELPRAVSDVVMQALEKDPERRPATAMLFAAALRAKAETPGATMRRGLVLALDRFPVFFRLVGGLLIPYYLMVLFELVVALMAAVEQRPHGPNQTLALVFAVVQTSILVLAGMVARGIAVLVVAQILLAPLKQTRLSLALSTFRRLWYPVLQIALVWTALVVIPFLIAVLCGHAGLGALGWSIETGWRAGPGDPTMGTVLVAVAAASLVVSFVFWCDTLQLASAVLGEGLGPWAALRRSRELARRTMPDTYLLAIVNMVVVGLPWVVAPWLVSMRATAVGVLLSVVGLALYRHVGVVIFSVMVAVLYFKQRMVEAEPIEPVLEQQFVAEPPPRSLWERRLDSSPAASRPDRAVERRG